VKNWKGKKKSILHFKKCSILNHLRPALGQRLENALAFLQNFPKHLSNAICNFAFAHGGFWQSRTERSPIANEQRQHFENDLFHLCVPR